ncbi:YidC/Oxa1 family membrane protein insertase [Streptomyces sp. NBC_01808]|uniref:YidC/Oxa1 family membrane protein insertase n=1 Tax=Streptomyces sp. NBC_01808 TaxID=2975947 RepID=UPI002DDB2C3C|nr:YidC/Oxa1 family membrane protein insertase [Streptomyces sp. NBC_01808]WSA38012.1 YidC/Oxa1 family membrane protein insertase [Streptomyces sp. NBC_01808]
MSVFGALSALLSSLADTLDPLFGASATGVAIIVFTLCVRLALHPLARAAARGDRVRRDLAPQVAEIQRKHRHDPERLRRALTETYAEAGASPLAGCGPMVLQIPVFMVMYRLFTGHDHDLLTHTLLGAPLGGRWSDALADGGVFGTHGMVYAGLFAVIAGVAAYTFWRSRRMMAERKAEAEAIRKAATAKDARNGKNGKNGKQGKKAQPAAPPPELPGPAAGLTRWLPLLSFGTLVTAAIVPLAAGLYLATTTAWTAAERTLLYRHSGLRAEQGLAE